MIKLKLIYLLHMSKISFLHLVLTGSGWRGFSGKQAVKFFHQHGCFLCSKMHYYLENPPFSTMIWKYPTPRNLSKHVVHHIVQYWDNLVIWITVFLQIITWYNSYQMMYLLHKVKMQYVHRRLIASYFLFPWRNPAEMSRRSILFHN